jgi:acyl-CoA synthetase (AMP-forming)/AMP-acid ligase II
MPIADELAVRRSEAPDRPAVSVHRAGQAETLTWSALHDAAAVVAGGAAHLGPGPVALVLDNTPASVAVLLGLVQGGIDIAPMETGNSQLGDPTSPVRRVATALVVPPGYAAPASGLPLHTYVDLLAAAHRGGRPPGHEGEVLQLTSGSTGIPRLVRQPAENAIRGAYLYRDVHAVDDRDVLLAAVPLAHSFGLVGALTTALVTGAQLRTVARFGARAVLEGLRAGATTLFATPLGYQLLTGAAGPGGWRTALRIALSSGGPLDQATADAAEDRLGTPIRSVYGSTETGLIACRRGDDPTSAAADVGIMAPGVSWRLRTEDGTLLPYGEGGLLVRTSTMLRGYTDIGDPPPYDRGWYDTGDTARVGPDGRVVLLGRRKSFVNVGGRKVSTARVEAVVSGCAAVREVAAYGVLNGHHEEELWAALVLEDGYRAEDVMSYCRAHLTAYETPHRVRVLGELPRNAMGKVVRNRLPGVAA